MTARVGAALIQQANKSTNSVTKLLSTVGSTGRLARACTYCKQNYWQNKKHGIIQATTEEYQQQVRVQ